MSDIRDIRDIRIAALDGAVTRGETRAHKGPSFFRSMKSSLHDPGWVSNALFETGKKLHGMKLGKSCMGGRLLCPVVVV